MGLPNVGFFDKYLNEVHTNTQVMGGKFKGKCRYVDIDGNRTYVNTFGTMTATSAGARYSDSPNVSGDYGRRLLAQSDFEIGSEIDNWDTFRQNSDYRISFIQGQRFALLRKADQVFITGALGTNYTGQTGTDSTTFDWTNQVIGGAVGGTGDTGLNTAKLIAASEKLYERGYNPEDPNQKFYYVASSKQISDLLGDAKLSNFDYNTVKALVAGTVDSFMGFEFIRSELIPYVNTAGTGVHLTWGATTDLPVDTDSTGVRANFAYVKKEMAYGENPNMKQRLSERADKRYNTYAFSQIGCAATRLDETGVVLIEALEA